MNAGNVRDLPRCFRAGAASRDVSVESSPRTTTPLLPSVRWHPTERGGGAERTRGNGKGAGQWGGSRGAALPGEGRGSGRCGAAPGPPVIPGLPAPVTACSPSWLYLLVLQFGPEDKVMQHGCILTLKNKKWKGNLKFVKKSKCLQSVGVGMFIGLATIIETVDQFCTDTESECYFFKTRYF